jgi:putative DNA primase/helicase
VILSDFNGLSENGDDHNFAADKLVAAPRTSFSETPHAVGGPIAPPPPNPHSGIRQLAGSEGVRFSDIYLDELRARTPLSALIGRHVRLKRQGKQWAGCCPFHGEKTASFYVYDDHYHCFGCGAHGDAIDFVQQIEGVSFKQAVARLSGEAGLGSGSPVVDEARRAKVARAKAKRDREFEADQRARLRKARFIAGKAGATVSDGEADAYLVGTRGIPRPTAGWPACVRWMAPWRDIPGSVVFVATDAADKVYGVQRVLIDAAGRNVRDDAGKNVKVSRGLFREHAAVVRLPGAADGPLLLAEGPETGLSVWAATGYETWIAVGSITHHQPPEGRRVVVCRDDDPLGSKADVRVSEAVAAWRLAGLDVVVAMPWPFRRSDRSDFNDTIRDEGRDAVLCRIEAALYPTLPPGARRRVTVEEGRKQTKTAMQKFFGAVKNGHGPDLSMGIRVETGIGKSASAREEAAELLVDMRAKGDNRTLIFAVDTHVLGDEAIGEFLNLPLVREHGFTAGQWRGRTAEDPEVPDWTMCTALERVKAAQIAGADPERACCRRELDDGTVVQCIAYDLCGYQRQKRQGRADVWFVAHEAIFSAKPSVIDRPAAVIFDESFWQAGLEGTDGGIELTVDTLDRAASLEGLDGQRQRFLRGVALDVLRSHADSPFLRAAFKAAGLTPAMAMEAHALEWRLNVVPDLHPGMPDEDFRAAEVAAEANRTVRRLGRFWKALAALLAEDGPEQSGWLAVDTVRLKQGDVRMIRMKGRKTIKEGWIAPTLMIDANFKLGLVKYFFPTVELIADIAVNAPHQRIIQIDGRSNSKNRLIDAPKAKPSDNDLREAHRMECADTLHKIARAYPGQRGLVVAQMAIETWLKDNAELPKTVELAHFNNTAGRDGWGPKKGRGGVGFVAIVGRVMPKASDVEAMAEALSGVAVKRIAGAYKRVKVAREMASGETATVDASQHPDPLCERIRSHICEGEVIQAIGRARGVNRTKDNPVDVYVLTDVPLPVPVDILVPATLLDPTPADTMLARGGVAFASSADAARAYPQIWTISAAKSAFRRAEKLGAFPYVSKREGLAPSLITVEYQVTGQGKRCTTAVFDLNRILDPRQHLEALLGELVAFRVLAKDQPAQAARASVQPTRAPVPTVSRQSGRATPVRRSAPFWANPPDWLDVPAWTLPAWMVPPGGGATAQRCSGVVDP